MARQPTLSPIEALGQARNSVGARGTSTVTSENRAFIRRWLVANDVPSFYVQTLSLKTLEGIWNYATDDALRACRIMGQKKQSQGYTHTTTTNDQPLWHTVRCHARRTENSPYGLLWKTPIWRTMDHT